MKIFRVITDVNSFQSLQIEDSAIWNTDRLTFDGITKQISWEPPSVYVLRPKNIRGNFFHLAPGTFVLDHTAHEALRDILERCGELLPLPFENTTLWLFNVLQCLNVLNQERTKWVLGKTTGQRIRIEKYAFHPDRLIEAPVFKIPETSRSEILVYENFGDPEIEFRKRVEDQKLSGLIFEEIWSN